MLIRELLDYCSSASPDAARVLTALLHADDQEFCWALDAGLGPLIYHVLSDSLHELPIGRLDRLRAADLTARVLHDARIEATQCLLEACYTQGIVVTLLKGISTSEELYARGHMRRMNDVDVLVSRDHQPVVEEIAQSVGFEYGVDEPLSTLQHGVPMYNKHLRVWLEVHRSLFPSDSALSDGDCFGEINVLQETRSGHLGTNKILRLSPALQLAYVASYWMRDIVHDGVHPGCVMTLFDAALLLRKFDTELRWTEAPPWLDNDIARGALQTLLPLLGMKSGPIDIDALKPRSPLWRIGLLQASAMSLMLDRHLLAGRPWTWPFAPPVPGRYNLLRQLSKRVLGSPSRAVDW